MFGNTDWIKELKVGDEVGISEGAIQNRYRIDKVTKISKTGIITTSHKYSNRPTESLTRFNPNGQERVSQDAYYRDDLVPLTQEIRDKIKKDNLVNFLSRVSWADWDKMELNRLSRIYLILKEGE